MRETSSLVVGNEKITCGRHFIALAKETRIFQAGIIGGINSRFFKTAIFQNRQFSNLFLENFTDWSLGIVGLIDAKGIDVA